MVGNKCDAENKRQVTIEEGKELGIIINIYIAKNYGVNFIETSAKDTLNIDELFNTISADLYDKQTNVSGLKKNIQKEKVTKDGEAIVLESPKIERKKAGCCGSGKKK